MLKLKNKLMKDKLDSRNINELKPILNYIVLVNSSTCKTKKYKNIQNGTLFL